MRRTNSTRVSLRNNLHKDSVNMVQFDKDTLSCFIDFENDKCAHLVEAGSKMRRYITSYKLHVHPKYGSKTVCASVADDVKQCSDGVFYSVFSVNGCGKSDIQFVDLHGAERNLETRVQLENTVMALESLEEKEFRLSEVSDYDRICEKSIYKSDRKFQPSKSTYSEMVSVRANEGDEYVCTPVLGSVANIITEPEMTGDDSCKPDEMIYEYVPDIGKESCFRVAKDNLVKKTINRNFMLTDSVDKEACVDLINDGADSGGRVANDDTRRCDCKTDITNPSVVISDFSNEFRENNETEGHVMIKNTDICVCVSAPFDCAQTQAKVVITESENDINSLDESLVAEDVDAEGTYVKGYKRNEEGSRIMNNNTLKCTFQIPTEVTEIYVCAVLFTEHDREQGRNSVNNDVEDASSASEPLSSDVSQDGPVLSMGSLSENNDEQDGPVISLSTSITVDLHPNRDIYPIVDLHPNHDIHPIGLDRGHPDNPPIISLNSQLSVDLESNKKNSPCCRYIRDSTTPQPNIPSGLPSITTIFESDSD